MRRRNLDASRAELRIDVIVRDDGDVASDDRQHDLVADEVGISLIFRMHGNGAVAEHRLRAGRRDDELTGFVSRQDFEVREGSVQHRIPIDEPLAAIDQALVVEVDENLANRSRAALVHGKAVAAPVDGCAEPPSLLCNDAAGLLLPLPDAFDKRLATEIVLGFALGIEQALHDHLGRDTRVIHAGLP